MIVSEVPQKLQELKDSLTGRQLDLDCISLPNKTCLHSPAHTGIVGTLLQETGLHHTPSPTEITMCILELKGHLATENTLI